MSTTSRSSLVFIVSYLYGYVYDIHWLYVISLNNIARKLLSKCGLSKAKVMLSLSLGLRISPIIGRTVEMSRHENYFLYATSALFKLKKTLQHDFSCLDRIIHIFLIHTNVDT